MRPLQKTGFTEIELSKAVNDLIQGRSNASGTVTLQAGQTSTTVSRETINANAIVILSPTTANAAAALASTWWSIVAGGGSFTLAHANNAQTDRTFGYLVIGG